MSEPKSFTQDAIRDFMIYRGGKVTNHELVKHFKKFLTNPGTQEEARVLFKEYVNNLATITRDPDGGKQLVLKKRYRTPSIDQSFNTSGLPPTPLSPVETPTSLNLRYQPVYQSSFELDLGSPHRSPYRRLSSESLSSSYALRSPGTPTSPYQLSSPVFPTSSSGYQQIVTPIGYAAPSYQGASIPTSPQHLVAVEPPIGIPTGPVQPLGYTSQRMVPLELQNPSPSLPSIPTSAALCGPQGVPHSSSISSISQGHFKTSASSPSISSQDVRRDSPRRRSSNDYVFTDSAPPAKEHDPPPVPPRRRSSEKSITKMDSKDSDDSRPKESPGTPMSIQSGSSTPTPSTTLGDQKSEENKENVAEDSKISVKERMQKFDRMASESALLNKTVTTSSLNTNLHKKRQEKVSNAIARLAQQYVVFPSSEEDKAEARRKFHAIARFPSCLGAIDCTHVRIMSPGGNDPEIYRNRKGFFSINVQTVSDADLKITNIVSRWPGSTHDATIFNNSLLKSTIATLGNDVIVGDSGYPLMPNLITKINQPRNRAETRFNESQIRTRNVVERSYGVWKKRFPVLSNGLRVNLHRCEAIIVATAVLHNIAIMLKEEEPDVDSNTQHRLDETMFNNQGPTQNTVDVRGDHRRRFIRYFDAL